MRPLVSLAAEAAHYPGLAVAAPCRGAAASRLRPVAAVLLAALALAGCRHAPVAPTPPPPRGWASNAPADPARANAVLMRALGLVGTPYRYGGSTPEDGFDCSGLVNYVFRDMLDLRLPRSSRELSVLQGPRVPAEGLAPADLVFFAIDGRQVSHVGIYVGEGRFVHAPSSGGRVRVDSLDGTYWRSRYTGARRVLE